MTKNEFFKMRDEMRAKGLISEFQSERLTTDLTSYQIKEALEMLGNQKSAIFKTSGFGKSLIINENYISDKVLVTRRKVDELDNLHIERVK